MAATRFWIKLASLACVSISTVSVAQQKQSDADMQLALGTANGIVEAVIGNGDLKPARFAQVVAVPTKAAEDMKNAVGLVSNAVDSARSKADLPYHDSLDAELVEQQCVMGMIAIKPSFSTLRKLAADNPNNAQGVVSADADEMGEFKLKGMVAQPYTIFATGKVGMNVALWFVDIPIAGQSDRVKLTRPQITCYDPKGRYKP